MEDSRKVIRTEHVKWFHAVYEEYQKDNQGYKSPLSYIEGIYEGKKSYWAKIARAAGYNCKKRDGVYYFEA